MKNKIFRSGYVTVAGLPNVGKSTLINRILDSKIMAVSDKPQTTRNNILGIFTTKDYQVLFTDTPGYHYSDKDINKFFVKEAVSACKSADVIVFIFDGEAIKNKKGYGQNDNFIESIRENSRTVKIIPVLSKIDLIKTSEIAEMSKGIRARYGFTDDVIPISVPKSLGLTELIKTVTDLLPEGPVYYPEDELTDRDIRFLCSEIIREKIFLYTHEELPYSTAVSIVKYEENPDIHRIYADIYVEKDSQKGIIVGSGASMIKKIGMEARKDIEQICSTKVYLELFVKVKKNWTTDEKMLKEFGYK
ncbi:MAG: GTPase Era [bacterium]